MKLKRSMKIFKPGNDKNDLIEENKDKKDFSVQNCTKSSFKNCMQKIN